MKEGIYIDGPVEDGRKYTGFIIFYNATPDSGRWGPLRVSTFTRCTLPHILEHALARELPLPGDKSTQYSHPIYVMGSTAHFCPDDEEESCEECGLLPVAEDGLCFECIDNLNEMSPDTN